MSFTLSQLLQRTYRKLGQMETYTATGGSTSTAVCTTLTDIYSSDEDLVNGALFIIRDSAGASAAPEGEYQRISGYTQSSGTVTCPTTFTATVAAGDTIGIARGQYPLETMVSLANDALSTLGSFPVVDATTLTTADSQTEYANAVAWKYRPPLRIDIQTITNDANDNRWRPLYGWEVVPAAANTAGLIIFPEQYASGYKFRVWYEVEHPSVLTYNAYVREEIHSALATEALLVAALEWQNNRSSGTDNYLLQAWNNAKMKFENYKREYPIKKEPRRAKVLALGRRFETDSDDVDSVSLYG